MRTRACAQLRRNHVIEDDTFQNQRKGNFFVTQNSDSKRQKTDKFDNIKIESFYLTKKTDTHQKHNKKTNEKPKKKMPANDITHKTYISAPKVRGDKRLTL